MQHQVIHLKKISKGKFEQIKPSSNKTTDQSINRNKNHSAIFIEELRNEWNKKGLNTSEIDKFEAILNALKQPAVQEKMQAILKKVKGFITSDPLKGVCSKMTDSQVNDFLKKLLEQKETKQMMEQMLSNPDFSNNAMDLMKDVMNDENKSAWLSDMLGSTIDLNKKE
ncbi:hypothetical protein [Paraliobacillus salinarum]|uniref:hypothetical protein n=1 Tax=Paraliobacillus salinarum TaxID=1158996 RepID=UPI0015F58EA3|nr:hypothetical protein [Paraliobacillus salinarum]